MDGVSATARILGFEGVISKTFFETHGQTESALGLAPQELPPTSSTIIDAASTAPAPWD